MRIAKFQLLVLSVGFGVVGCGDTGSGGAGAVGGAPSGGMLGAGGNLVGGASSVGPSSGGVLPSGGQGPANGGSVAVGGANPAGGAGPATGGVGPATGGAGPATGGAGPATGGAGPATGGVGPATGGTTSTRTGAGGVGPATGGTTSTRTGTGGVGPATGGASTTSGGTKATGGTTSVGGTTSSVGGGTTNSGRPTGPCDVYASASPATPCVAAFSMVRALTKSYSGPLYQVRSGSSSTNSGTGGVTHDIGMTADGFADSAAQDAICAGTVCTVSKLYDQTGNGSDLTRAPKGGAGNGTRSDQDCYESSATKGKTTVGGHTVYSLYMAVYEGYRLAAVGKNMPRGTASQGIYMLADGTHSGTACCWDFGNVTINPLQYHTMNTLFLGTGYWGKGAGSGPWFLADFEGGVWAGGSGASSAANSSNPSMKIPYAFGILKTAPGNYAIRTGNGQSGALTTAYDGTGPMAMDNQGGITLGVGGDNSNNSWGTFFEGAITAGRPSDTTDAAVLSNVQAAGYGK